MSIFKRKKKEEAVEVIDTRQLKAVPQLNAGDNTDLGEVKRRDRSLYKTKVEDYRYSKSADELLEEFSKYDPDVSTGIWNFLRMASSGLTILALNSEGKPDQGHQVVLDKVLQSFTGVVNFKDWGIYSPIELTANSIIKYILLRGGCGLELVLNKNKTAKYINIVDPITVTFEQPKAGVYVPYQGDKKVNIPTFFWQLLDADANSPYETPPFLPVLQAILFNISVMQDLERVVKRTAYPRISVKIIESTLRKFAPVAAQTDDKIMSGWLKGQKEAIGESLRTLKPEDAAVFFDSLEVNVLETKNNSTIDFRPLKEVIDQRIISGMKSLPTILGRQFGSSQTIGGVEALLYAKSVTSLQRVAEHLLSRVLTLALRLEGKLGTVVVKYRPVSLRPENELEAFMGLKQARILEQLSLGMITDEEAAIELTGNPYLPAGYSRLSGTGFYKNSSDPASSLATRNPTAEEAAGNGRGDSSR